MFEDLAIVIEQQVRSYICAHICLLGTAHNGAALPSFLRAELGSKAFIAATTN
eukprot:SAG11_NODE_37413_length_257_cov_0.639241_1_plen_52_part_01